MACMSIFCSSAIANDAAIIRPTQDRTIVLNRMLSPSLDCVCTRLPSVYPDHPPFAMSLSMNRFRLAHHASRKRESAERFLRHILVRKKPAVIEAVQPRAREQGRGSLRQPLQIRWDPATPPNLKTSRRLRSNTRSAAIKLPTASNPTYRAPPESPHCVGKRSNGYFSWQWRRFGESGQIDYDYLPLGGQRIEESSLGTPMRNPNRG